MPLLIRENLLAAQNLYRERLEFLRSEIRKISTHGQNLGKDYEAETTAALDWIENEVEGIDECLEMLKYLLRR